MKKECHKKMKHVACSYHDYQNKNKDQQTSKEHKWAMHDYGNTQLAACLTIKHLNAALESQTSC